MVNDDMLPGFLYQLLSQGCYIIMILVIIVASNPLMIIPIILIALFVGPYGRNMARISTDYRRIAGILIAPVISRVSEIVEGGSVINNYNLSSEVRNTYMKGMNKVGSAFIHERLVVNCFYMRLEFLVSLLILGCTQGIAIFKILGFFIFEKSVYAITVTNLFLLC